MIGFRRGLATLALALLAAGPTFAARRAPSTIALPGGEGGVGLDDLGYSPALGCVLVPAGRTGRLDLVDPATGKVVEIPGFSAREGFSGRHDVGITSVTEGAGLLFVTDRTALRLFVVDPATRSIVGETALGASPDYVRWLEAGRELWVTEPDSQRIEIFRLEAGPPPQLTAVSTIPTAGGPESLVFDPRRRRAYTHLASWTVAFDTRTHRVLASWPNGCAGATGIALDVECGFLFVACAEGKVAALDVRTGKTLGALPAGGGIDIIAYDPERRHLYVPSARTAKLAIVGVSPRGALTLLGTYPGAAASHCVAARGKVYVADPARGRLLVIADPFPVSAP
ncbi:MAG TPA: hypothetical protein VGK89_01970 [Candidatus Eisenbacteria bacterium]|jgi:DNA-binding beta-propeller fold protein YncE